MPITYVPEEGEFNRIRVCSLDGKIGSPGQRKLRSVSKIAGMDIPVPLFTPDKKITLEENFWAAVEIK